MKSYHIIIVFLFFSMPLWGQSIRLKHDIPIVATHALEEGYGTAKNYKIIEECGFTLAVAFLPSKEEVISHLKSASKTKVKLIVWCPELVSSPVETIRLFLNYKSLGGYYVMDEPGLGSFSSLSRNYNKIREIDNSHYIWVNLYPKHATSKLLESDSYEHYLKQYILEVDPQFISFDNYGLLESGLRNDFFENLEIISKYCQYYNKPFWAYVLVAQFGNYIPPSKGTLSFQAYSNLAYGAQCIEYYTYKKLDGYKIAIVDSDYSKMPIYDEVKELNTEIRYYSKYIANCVIDDVAHYCDDSVYIAQLVNKLPDEISLVGYEGKGFIMTLFTKNKKKYLMLVNKDYENQQEITIQSKKRIKRLSYYKKERSRNIGLIKLIAEPGSIILLQI